MDRKLLVLDIDGTLVFAEYSVLVDDELLAVNGKPHFTLPLDEYDNRCGSIFVWKRPNVDDFLEWAFQNFDVAVWSASARDYVVAIVQNIFPAKLRDQLKFTWTQERYLITQYVLTRRCTLKRDLIGCYSNTVAVVKNLKKIWKHNKSKQLNSNNNNNQTLGHSWPYTKHNTLIVDDTPSTYEKNFGNAIPVNSWTGDPQDQELHRVKIVLQYLLHLPSVRYTEKRSWAPKYLC